MRFFSGIMPFRGGGGESVIKIERPFYDLRGLAVPVFMTMAFIFMGDHGISNIKKYRSRIARLLVPMEIWSIIAFVINRLLHLFSEQIPQVPFKGLLLQMAFGSWNALDPVLWFQFDIIVWTVSYYTFNKMFGNKSIIVFSVLVIFALEIQYNGVNAELFSNLPDWCKWPIGRLAETYPFTFLGFVFGKYHILDKIKKSEKLFVCIIICLSFEIALSAALYYPAGFGYSGLILSVRAIFLIIIFYLIPFDKLPTKLLLLIKHLSLYSMGVYFSHWIIGQYLNSFSLLQTVSDFVRSVYIFIICLIVSITIGLLFPKIKKYIVC